MKHSLKAASVLALAHTMPGALKADDKGVELKDARLANDATENNSHQEEGASKRGNEMVGHILLSSSPYLTQEEKKKRRALMLKAEPHDRLQRKEGEIGKP